MTQQPIAAVSAIVLAGGRSSRFGRDKLRAEVDGKSLLELAIRGVASVASDIVVVVAPGQRPPPSIEGLTIRSATDREEFGGPLVGLVAGLETVREPLVVLAGGDMPSLQADVLGLMIRTLAAADDGVGAVTLELRGRAEPLPAVVRTGATTDVAGRLVAGGERSLRSLFEHLATRVLVEGDWRPLDPEADTLRDVDRPSDL